MVLNSGLNLNLNLLNQVQEVLGLGSPIHWTEPDSQGSGSAKKCPNPNRTAASLILKTFNECRLGESCFFMEWNILLLIAFTIPPSLNIPLTLTSFPSIPIRSISFSNGTLAFPTVYSSWQLIMSYESYMPEPIVMWGLLFSLKPAAIAAGNTFLFSPWDFWAQR